MKRFTQGFVALIATLTFMGGVAGAQEASACEGATITNTGPGSVNEIKCVESNKVHVSCVNNIYVVNDNSQNAGSGNATTGGNTTGGSAITGNATNENGTTVQIGASCGSQPVVTTPEVPTPSNPVTPTTTVAPQEVGGRGAGIAPAPFQEAVTVATLPNTSSNPVLDTAVTAGASLTGLLIASQVGMAVYRRFALR
jgi:hypothetical protein